MNKYTFLLLLSLYSIINFAQSATTDFVTVWKTDNAGTTNSTSIKIPVSGGSYDVDWDNDGNFDETGLTGNVTHDYGTAGTYTVRIRGSIDRIFFNYAGDKLKILDVSQWGNIAWTNMARAFSGCANLNFSATDSPDLSNVTNMEGMFYYATSFNSDISSWDVSHIKNMGGLFSRADVFNQPLDNWDVSNVVTMENIFQHAHAFNKPLNNWTTTSLTKMKGAFTFASVFNQPLGNWDVSGVSDFSFVFRYAEKFNQNINSWDVSNATNMGFMFSSAYEFNQPLDNWNSKVSNVTIMSSMFENARQFNQNIGGWVTTNLDTMINMFREAIVFNQNINSWDISNVTNLNSVFYRAYKFNQPLNSWNTSNVTFCISTFDHATEFNQNINSWDVSNVISMKYMFSHAENFNQPLDLWTTTSLRVLENTFEGAISFNQPLNAWDVSKVKILQYTFYSTPFNQPLDNWDVSAVTNMVGTFRLARQFNQDITNWNVSSVTNMGRMFWDADSFDQNIGSWNVSNVINMWKMFENITLTTANYDAILNGWNAQTLQPNVGFWGGNSKYCMGKDARQNMIDSDGWNIVDSGYGCDDCSGKVLTWDGSNFTDGSDTVVPDDLTPVTLTANYNNGSFNSCNCTINNGVTLTVKQNESVSVTKDLINNGSIIVENEGSFIQTSVNATISGSGSYKVHKTTRPYVEYDYSYWSSPTVGETVEDAFQTNSTLSAGTSANSDNATPNGRIYWLNTANFNDGNGDTFDDEQDAWTTATGAMTPGKGYIAMGAGADFPFNTTFATGLEQSVFFEGEFNNAEITIPVVADNDASDNSINENLIGNPYPSAIDIKKLMEENSSLLSGTFYFWTHDSPIDSDNSGPHAYNFTNADYAVATVNGTSFNAVSGGTAGTPAPEFIASCQGFIAKVDTPGNLKFTNAMRVKANNNQFLRPSTLVNSNENKFRLNMTNDNGLFRQILIGFNENAINGVDKLDGTRNLKLEANFYSTIDGSTDKFAIQLQDNFDDSKIIPLGLDIINAGNYTISLSSVEGVFANNQTIYLEDLYTNTIHNLSTSNYTFYTNEGLDIENRFILRFNNSALSVGESELFTPIIYPNPSTGKFNVSLKEGKSEIKIFDITGKKVLSSMANSSNFMLDLSQMDNGVYFMEIYADGFKFTEKIILKK